MKLTVTYTGFDKVGKVKQGTDSICYTYGYDHQRIFMEERMGTNVRTKRYWGNCEYVTEGNGSTSTSYWRTFVTGPYGVFAVVETRNGTDATHYVLKDNLGSWTTITNSSGTVEQQLSYDAWGNLRNPNTWANYTANDTYNGPMFDRGYTGHEHLTSFGLINMNGRMYDPVMSSFLSADRFVQNPLAAQGFNRYAYCMNNPLRFVDPTGWLPGGGGGNGEHPPGELYYVNGMPTVDLPEITILADNPSLSNRLEKMRYNTYYYGGERLNLSWASNSEGPSIGPNGGGCGGGSGSHGGNGRASGLIRAEIQNTIYNYLIQYEFSNIALGAKIASYAGCDFNKKMFWNYWNGQGDYELTTSEFEEIVALSIQKEKPSPSEWNDNPAFATLVTLYGTKYENAIGTTTLYYDLNGNAIGLHEPYDFNLFPIRDSKIAQIKTTLVWGASLYNVHNKDFYINYNYHP